MSSLLENLNEKQLAAVSAPHAHRLVLAGAGSGKTRVLVHRMAWLMAEQNISPYSILSVTFTNKAAHEMRGRIESLRQSPATGMWIGTFHGLSHRLLRTHWQEADLPESFQILDSDDQQRLIKRLIRSLEIDENKFPPKQVQWFINKCKEEGKRAKKVSTVDYFNQVMQRVYLAYEEACKRSGLVDFSELLLRSLEMLQSNDSLREHYQERFLHILVDEFQDTNTIQYQWLCTLRGENTAVMAVGDDDQSIYSWRGAKIENIHRFCREFKGCETIRLEQNYRSTQTILNAANAVIANNSERLGKELWTEANNGDTITVYAAYNEHDEAHYIASSIRSLVNDTTNYNEVAILYRSNAQSRLFEESLLKGNIPYRIYGGQKFFERAEIKDALAYLRLIANRHDDAAFERVVNLPTRGIGNATLSTLRETARDLNASLWQASQQLISQGNLTSRAASCLQQFLDLITAIDERTHEYSLEEQTDYTIKSSGLLTHYQKDRSEKGLSRVENLEELVTATEQFEPAEELGDLSLLAAFLSHVALEAGEGQADEHSNCVSLMTLHAAKGLEFPVVFLAGMEEGLFPHKMSTNEPRGLEEERRLCYVGMTRAMRKLFLLHAESRRLYGTDRFHTPSRFLKEIPSELLHSVRPHAKVSRPSNSWQQRDYQPTYQSTHKPANLKGNDAGESGLKIGQRVNHKKFGEGVILNYEGNGSHTRIQVQFNKAGTKWLVAAFAKLTPI